MKYLEDVDHDHPEFGDLYDELSLWSAPFGLLLLDRVRVGTDLTILDVGAGTGFLTVELAQRCGEGATVIAVDPWAAGMVRLRRKLDYLGIGNVQLFEESVERVELPDGSIDLAVSNLGINNFANPELALGQCARLLKSGGALVLTTNLVGHMAELYEIYRETLIELGLEDRLPAFEAHVAHRGTVESIVQLLVDAGLEVGEVTTESFRLRYADGSALLQHYFIRLGFLPAWRAIVPDDLVEATFGRLEEKLNSAAAERGELALTIPVACVEARKP